MLGLGRGSLYRALWTCSRVGGKPGNAFLFVAAGLLRADDLQAAALEEFRDFGTSALEVDEGLYVNEKQFYARVLPPSGRVLVAGCGAGRDLIALRALGYDAEGLDPLPAMVDHARAHLARRGMTAPIHTSTVQDAVLEGSYDAVILSNGCYSFIRTARARVATLRRLGPCLSAGGCVIFSYFPFTRQSALGRWLIRTSARLARADWSPEPGDVFSRHSAGERILRYRHDFTREELAGECTAAGLRIVAEQERIGTLRFAAAVPVDRV
jgi:SAM-dependent methyltransferase